jgi:hypothetical protein
MLHRETPHEGVLEILQDSFMQSVAEFSDR